MPCCGQSSVLVFLDARTYPKRIQPRSAIEFQRPRHDDTQHQMTLDTNALNEDELDKKES